MTEANTNTFISFDRLTLRDKNDDDSTTSLVLGLRDNVPRVTVFSTSDAKPKAWGGFEYFSFTGFLQSVKLDLGKVLDQSTTSYEIHEKSCTCSYRVDGVKTVTGGIVFGMNKDGVFYLGFRAKEGFQYLHDFDSHEWHELRIKKDSKWGDMPRTYCSALLMLRYINLVLAVYETYMSDLILGNGTGRAKILTRAVKNPLATREMKEPKNDPKPPQRPVEPTQEFDDDIPF